MVDTKKLDDLCGGFILRGLGAAYGFKESELFKHSMSVFLSDTYMSRLINDIVPKDNIITISALPEIREINESKKWVVLNPLEGKEPYIELSDSLIELLPINYMLYVLYNKEGYRIETHTVRCMPLFTGNNNIPLRYFTKIKLRKK